jgi:glycosyltransferase involved in cell wall biosynthesis
MNKKPDVSLILPCFNETDVFDQSVRSILHALSSSAYTYEIIFVDDKSLDQTRAHIREVCRVHPFCFSVFHAKNKGRGAAVDTGIHHARADVVGYIDIDCEVSPLYIPHFVKILQSHEADIVIGRRIYRTTRVSLVREVLSIGYRALAKFLLGTGGMDTETGYKFFNKRVFYPVLQSIQNQGWFWDTESIVRSLKAGLRVREEPVLFVRRGDKHSSVKIIPDTIEYLKNIWVFYWQIRTA